MRALLIALPLVLASPAVASAVVVAPERGHQVARHLGALVWSERARDGRYHLTSREGRLPAVAPLDRPFDVDLGTDSRGRVAAVYSRCHEGRRGCRIRLYDLAARRETALYRGHRPALRQGVLAFARLRGDGRDAIIIRRLGPKGVERRVHVLPRSLPATTGLDLGAGGLAFSAAGRGTRLWLKPPGRGRVRVLADGAFTRQSLRVHGSPSFAGRFLYWAYSDRIASRPPNGWAIRRDVRNGRTTASPTPGYLESLAADAGRPGNPLVIATFAGNPSRAKPGEDRVATLERPRWGAPPRSLGVRR